VHPVTSYADMTDACLVALAKARGLKLATLDGSLSGKAWAKGVAENSF
jgi:predicted nucleic acid-binding protein